MITTPEASTRFLPTTTAPARTFRTALYLLILFRLACFSLPAQVKYTLVQPEVLQARVNAYKGNDSVREETLRQLFLTAGCTPSNLSTQVVPKHKQRNVICVLPGSSADTVVVGAHFDHVSEGDGIIDNWSGSSLLPSLLQTIASAPRTHTFVFVGFAAEETGEVGSATYVDNLSRDQTAHLQLMVNLDTLGLGPSEVWLRRSDKRAIALLSATAKLTNLPISGMNMDGVGESDEEPFVRRNFCTITIHSLTPETLHILHSQADAPSALHFRDYYDSYRLLSAYLFMLDARLGQEPSTCPQK